jgi:hypothetical protein
MLTIIKASLLALAMMLLESCTGYLTSYQTPALRGTSANVYSTRRYSGAGSTVAITEESNQRLTSCIIDGGRLSAARLAAGSLFHRRVDSRDEWL